MTKLEMIANSVDTYLNAAGHIPEAIKMTAETFSEAFAEDPNVFSYKDNKLYLYGMQIILVKSVGDLYERD